MTGVRWRAAVRGLAGTVVASAWEATCRIGRIDAGDRRARRFGAFGVGSSIAFPPGAVYGQRSIHIGRDTMIGPDVTLSVGMGPGQTMVTDPVVRVGDRCVIGRGSALVGHFCIDVGDDVYLGMGVYVTDQNHGYERLDQPVGRQAPVDASVRIGAGGWIGAGAVVLPGSDVGEHVVVAANSVVRGTVPDRCVVAGAPARIVRHWDPDAGWVRPRPPLTRP